ncbi:MAG TPA: double zinc ribbon domain-containing protein [Desulfomonilia bacterium]|nr:double zinc ribbon domain-containing protein [Desulfomonilia bacterium]
MLRSIFAQIFPPRCLVCGDQVVDPIFGVCSGCASRIRPLPRPVCMVCGNPTGTEGICLGCQAAPPPYDRLMSAAFFDGPLKEMIHAFKYADATYYKKYLARVIYDVVKNEARQCDLITFVPLHWSRLMTRGYNQSALLARELSRLTGIPVGYGMLKKTKGTPPQVGLTRHQRKANIAGTFQARGVSGKAVLVVDDVVTTGQTALEVSRTLKKAGAEYILFASAGRSLS